MLLVASILIWTFAAVLTAVTVLPLSSSRRWWVRIWDFPRLHIAFGFLVVGLLALVAPVPGAIALVAIAVAGFAYQGSWIWRYTPLARREVEFAPDADNAFTLLAANVLQENTRHGAVRDLIDRVDPDVLLLMETDATWSAALQASLARYPTVVRELRDDYYGMIFATKLAVTDARIVHLTRDDTPTLLAELRAPDGAPFRYVGLHPQPPTPDGADADERDAQIIYAARFARRSNLPLVVMGDFNEAAWSKGALDFKRLGRYVDPRIGRGLYASFHANHMMIRCPIDQIYVTEELAVVSIGLGPRIGSDHFPMMARLRVEPALAARLNTPPRQLAPEEIDSLDEITAAYRERLDAAGLDAEAKAGAASS